MMYIEGHWESVDTLDDIIKVIREYYNPELADEMEFQIERMVDAFNNKIESLEYEIWSLEDELEDDDLYDD